jgi:DNA repair photolyase
MSRVLPLFPELPPALTLRDVAEAVKAAGIDGLPDARRRADDARYQEVDVRSAMTATRGMPFRWALNPYRGCTHACEYCYARKYQRHLELGAGDEFSSVIFVKRNLVDVLRREVTKSSWPRELVAIGTATDPYQPIEGHYRLTRRSVEVLVDSGTPFSIVTKGPMVLRDADVFTRPGARGQIYLSVPSVDEAAWTALEPGTAPPAQRLRAATALREAGVDVAILMMPLVPGVTTSRAAIERTVDAIAATGVRFAGAGVTHLEAGVREHFFAFLDREFPDLREGYDRLYAGGAYVPAAYATAIREVVAVARARCGATGGPAAPSAP